jgi:hypothetical protein
MFNFRNSSLSGKKANPPGNVCPLCFEEIREETHGQPGTEFFRYCPDSGKAKKISGKAIFALNSNEHTGSNRPFDQQPFLAHIGCKHKNPLRKGEGELAKELETNGSLLWYAGNNKSYELDHWSLSIICEATKKVPGVEAMWFPIELFNAFRTGRGKRIFLRGSRSVGKSVLSSLAITGQTYSGSQSVTVQNYGYASPSPDVTAPYNIYANVLQTQRDFTNFQPIVMSATQSGVDTIMRAGFFSDLPRSIEKNVLVFYDFAGEHLSRALGTVHRSHLSNSNVVFALIDVTDLSIFEGCYELDPGETTFTKKERISEGINAAFRALEQRKSIETIVVVTKLDLVNLEAAEKKIDLTTEQRKGLEQLQKIKKQLEPAIWDRQDAAPDPKSLSSDSRNALENLLHSKVPYEEQLSCCLDQKLSGVFFVWTDGLVRPAPAVTSTERNQKERLIPPYQELKPVIPHGIVELVMYTLGL